jgi:hypothetical protein
MVGIFNGYVSQNQMVHGLHAPAMETEDPHHAGNSPNSDVILLTFSKKTTYVPVLSLFQISIGDRFGISWPRRETFEKFHCLPAITDDYGKTTMF